MFTLFNQLTDGNTPTTLLGVISAGYSFGTFVMSPILGFWSDQRSIKEPLIACLLASFVANIAYSYASALPNGGQYLVLVTRIVVGGCAGASYLYTRDYMIVPFTSSGITSVVRSYIVYATTEEERSIGNK